MLSIIVRCECCAAADIKPLSSRQASRASPDVRPGRRSGVLVREPSVTPVGATEMWVFGSALFLTAMIEVDDSEIPEDDRLFLQEWADALNVPLSVLVLRILEAAIDGEQYIKKRPRYEED